MLRFTLLAVSLASTNMSPTTLLTLLRTYVFCVVVDSGQEASSKKSDDNHDNVQSHTTTGDGSRAVDTIRELARKAEARGVTLESTFSHFDKVNATLQLLLKYHRTVKT
jgi:hypothetical protein